MDAVNTQKVKVPCMDPYDGTTDPDEHLAAYKTQMTVQTGNEASWCKFFPTMLKGIALTRFSELSSGIITSFEVLEAYFR